ncbi:MAG: hypothetical protein ACAH80_01520 [Alphaproteobacteria bacterium]
MDQKTLEKYPLAEMAFMEHDDFYARHVEEGMSDSVKKSRERMLEIFDRYVDCPPYSKDALMVVGLISLDPLACNQMYGDPYYGLDVDALMIQLVERAKEPGAALPYGIAAIVTTIAVVKMEEAMDNIQSGRLAVTPAEVKGTLARASANDAMYLPNLKNRDLQDLYETTQLAFFCTVERAAKIDRKPPPPDFGGPVF